MSTIHGNARVLAVDRARNEGLEQEARRVLVLSTTAFTALFAVWLMFGVLGVAIKKELGLSQLQFSWLAAIAVLSGSLGRLPFGIATDRFGGKVLMTALLLGTAVPCFLVSRATSFGALVACAFLLGIAGNSFSVGVAWNAGWASAERQGFALGVFGAGNVGASLTKLLGPALIAVVPASGYLGGWIPGGWRFVPVLYAFLLIVLAAAVWILGPVVDRRPSRNRSLRHMLIPLRNVRIWRFGLYYVVVFGAYVALSLWLPNYYQSVYHVSLARAALLTAFFIFPASLLRPVGGWLSDRFGARPVTYGVFFVMSVVSVLLSAPEVHLGPCFVLIELLGVCMGIGKASVYKYIATYFPSDVGAVGGLVGTLGALGGFFLPLGFALFGQWSGRPQSCFWLLFGLVVGSFGWLHATVARMRGAAPLARAAAAAAATEITTS
jgi:NNP family nitrate/nitrite transporter-like MFS transporter